MTDKQNYEIAAQSILGRKQKGPSKGRKFFDLAFAFMENLKDTKTKQAQEKTATRLHNLNNTFADEEARLKVISDRAVAAVKRLNEAQNHDGGYEGYFRDKAASALKIRYDMLKDVEKYDPFKYAELEKHLANQMRKHFEASYKADTGLENIEDTPPTEAELYGVYERDIENIKKEINHPSRQAAFPKLRELVGYENNDDYDIAVQSSLKEIEQKKLIKRYENAQEIYRKWANDPANTYDNYLKGGFYGDPVVGEKRNYANLELKFQTEVIQGVFKEPQNQDKDIREIVEGLKLEHKILYQTFRNQDKYKYLPAIPGYEDESELKAIGLARLLAASERTEGNLNFLTEEEKALSSLLFKEEIGNVDYTYTKTELDTSQRGITEGTIYNAAENFFNVKNADDYPNYQRYTNVYNGLDNEDKQHFLQTVLFNSKYLEQTYPDKYNTISAIQKALEIQKFGLRPVGLTEGTGIVRGKEEQFIPQDFMEIDEYLTVDRTQGPYGISNVLAKLNGQERYKFDINNPLGKKGQATYTWDDYTKSLASLQGLNQSEYTAIHTSEQTGIKIGFNKNSRRWEELPTN